MTLLFISILAGMLSVLAPCVIAILPILLARSADGERSRSPFWIIGGLSGSILLFSVLLKASTVLVAVPTNIWQIVSGVIIILFGFTYLFPELWEKLAGWLHLQEKANKTSGKALQKRGVGGDIILGASLGPVFGACSPTYALIVAGILPTTPIRGLAYLLAFIAGLASILALISIFGSAVVKKLGWSINPHGWFKRVLGIIFLIVGLLIASGYDKKVLSYTVQHGWFDWQVRLESNLQQ